LVSVAIVPELSTASPANAAAELPLEDAAPPLIAPLFWSAIAVAPLLLTAAPPTATPVALLCFAPPPLIAPLFVRVPIVCAFIVPMPPNALTAPVAMPPFMVLAALLIRLVIVAVEPLEIATPPAACEFPVPAPPWIVPLLVSIWTMPELETPWPPLATPAVLLLAPPPLRVRVLVSV
jgi:hypothetical protein